MRVSEWKAHALIKLAKIACLLTLTLASVRFKLACCGSDVVIEKGCFHVVFHVYPRHACGHITVTPSLNFTKSASYVILSNEILKKGSKISL